MRLTTLFSFLFSPLIDWYRYVLARHLHRDQEIEPNSPELGKFRGEPVYTRSAVLSLKTTENWMRRGRSVRTGEQPMKFVKQRASTVGRKREIEVGGSAVRRPVIKRPGKVGGVSASSSSRPGLNGGGGSGGSVVKKPQIPRRPGRTF